MGIRKLISDQKQYGYSEDVKPKKREGWVRLKSSTSRHTTVLGTAITTKTTKYERHLLFLSKTRIASIALGVLAVIGTLGFSLCSKRIRQLFSGRQVYVLEIKEKRVKERPPRPEPAPTVAPIAQAYDETLQEMLNEIQPHAEAAEKTAHVARKIHKHKSRGANGD
jgi:hypothetical protein